MSNPQSHKYPIDRLQGHVKTISPILKSMSWFAKGCVCFVSSWGGEPCKQLPGMPKHDVICWVLESHQPWAQGNPPGRDGKLGHSDFESWHIMGVQREKPYKPSDHELYLLRMVPAVKVVVNTSAFFAGGVYRCLIRRVWDLATTLHMFHRPQKIHTNLEMAQFLSDWYLPYHTVSILIWCTHYVV